MNNLFALFTVITSTKVVIIDITLQLLKIIYNVAILVFNLFFILCLHIMNYFTDFFQC